MVQRKKIILFGTGKNYQTYKKYFPNEKIVALLDNDSTKQGTIMDGHTVLDPSEIHSVMYDAIFCLGIHWQEMKNQLMSLGVDSSKIFCQDDIREVLGNQVVDFPVKYFHQDKMHQLARGERIVLLAHDLSYTGATIVLLYLADVLTELGYHITFASAEAGDMLNFFLERNISLIIDENLRTRYLDELPWVDDFGLVVVNTLEYAPLLTSHQVHPSIIWWLHDSPMLYAMRNMERLKNISLDGIYLCAAGEVARQAFKRYWPDVAISILPYGLPDFYDENLVKRDDDFFIFAIVGGVIERKAQDIFLDAVEILPADYRRRCKFLIIGDGQGGFARQIKERAHAMQHVQFLGNISREEIKLLYHSISVLVCPSRSDTLPVVVAEAFMNHVPAIVSDVTGMTAFVKYEENGLVCRTGSSSDLADKMVWMIDHEEYIQTMGDSARKVFDDEFSIKKLRKNIAQILKNISAQ